MKILVVEDLQEFRTAVVDCLQSMPEVKKVIGIETYADAMLCIKEHSDIGLVITDINLGTKRLNGFVILDAMMTLPKPIPVAIMTGECAENIRERSLDAGAIAFLQKPFSYGELYAVVKMAMALGAVLA